MAAAIDCATVTRAPTFSSKIVIAPVISSLSSTSSTCGVPSTSGVGRRFDRYREEETAAGAQIALDPDTTAVQLDELARDREAEACAVVRARRRRVDLCEFAEDQLVMFRRDTHTGVADFDQPAAVMLF